MKRAAMPGAWRALECTLPYETAVLACPPDRLRASFFNADESEAVVFERYRDAGAALEHFANIGHLMEPLMETATITGEVLGTPNAEMRRNLTGDQPKLYTPWMTMSEVEGAGAE